MADREPATMPGDILAGKYRVERILGKGGMGMVVAATHLDLAELRAIKLLTAAARGHAGSVERFLREARAAVRLKNDHVVRVHDVARFDSGEPYVVMEYLEGHDLAHELARGALPIDEAVGLVMQALEAIAEAHALGIIHRDLKPANLFITKNSRGEPFLKILDFGISKLTGDAARGEDEDLTRTTTILGTPYYMSPEQMRSSKDVDARADVWSIGVILYELLTGKLPFSGTSLTELCMKVAQDAPPSPAALRSDIPDELSRIVLRCLEKNREDRFADVAQLALALAPFGGVPAEEALKRIADARGVCLVRTSPPGSAPARLLAEGSGGVVPNTSAGWQQGSIVLPMQGNNRRWLMWLALAVLVVGAGAAVWSSRSKGAAGDRATAVAAQATSTASPAAASSASTAPGASASLLGTHGHDPASAAAAASATSAGSAASEAPTAQKPHVPARTRARADKPRAPADPFGAGRE